MLKDRILSTLKFFDLQDMPLTLAELRKFLVVDVSELKSKINTQWELVGDGGDYQNNDGKISIGEILNCLEKECNYETEQKNGFYCLRGRVEIINLRSANYLYGIKRERLIKKYAAGLRHLPFVRGVALAGSQAMGLQKKDSDIDLLIIVDQKFLWLARTCVTVYFQVLGKRRHGKKITDRFCLNHYLAGVKTIGELKNLYTAWEYGKLRPLVYPQTIAEFQQKNRPWIGQFFSNFEPMEAVADRQSSLQYRLEGWFGGKFGNWLEGRLRSLELSRIKQDDFILVRDDELSFHPQSKQKELLRQFFLGN